MGVEPPFDVTYKDIGNGQYATEIDTNFSNPDQWASPMVMHLLKTQKVRPYLIGTLFKSILE